MKFRVSIGVFAGDFPAQQLVFAHLMDVCPDADLDQVEVLARPFAPRLGHFFDAGTVSDLPEDTLVLTFPGAGVPLTATDRLRVVGRFTGTITRAHLPED